MKDIQTIKTRLAAIQGNFNPKKNTYQVIEYVVNNDLNYNEMLMELSKIKGFSKYPEGLKNEYVSIINDIKENIINQRKKEEEERKKANTRELKDIIDSLEKTRIQYLMKQEEEAEEVLGEDDNIKDNHDIESEKDQQVVNLKSKESKIVNQNDTDIEENLERDTENENSIPKVKKSLVFGIILMIVLIGVAILFY